MYQIDYSNRFSKDLKRCMKRGLNIKLIKDAIDLLAEKGSLPQEYRPHKLVNQNRHITSVLIAVLCYYAFALIFRQMNQGLGNNLYLCSLKIPKNRWKIRVKY